MVLNAITIISWYMNNNNCIITQIEDKLFDQTLIDIYNNLINKKKFIINLEYHDIIDMLYMCYL